MSVLNEQPKYLEVQMVLDLIDAAKDRFFSVTFVKRTTGELRRMNCRRNVGGMANVPVQTSDEARRLGVVTVYDVKASGFRRIPLDSVLEIKT